MDDVRDKRRETRQGNRTVICEPGRTIVREGDRTIVRHNEADRFRIIAGCDKRAETCRKKFSNLLNFRGFPLIPGDDWVTAYPKEGANHDGSSLLG